MCERHTSFTSWHLINQQGSTRQGRERERERERGVCVRERDVFHLLAHKLTGAQQDTEKREREREREKCECERERSFTPTHTK